MAETAGRGRGVILAIALVCAAPIVASYLIFYFGSVDRTMNYGELLDPAPMGEVTGRGADGREFRLSSLRGKWVFLVVDSGACAEGCARKLYAVRQARKMQGKDQDRVARLMVATDEAALPAGLAESHPDLIVARAGTAAVAWLPGGAPAGSIFLVDPAGRVILRYPSDPDIKRINKDLVRLLKASRIG